MQLFKYQDWLLDEDVDLDTIANIADVAQWYADKHDIDYLSFATALSAVLFVESRCQHWDGEDVITGDGGASIGIGQIQLCWELHFKRDRYNRYDNIWMAAGVLIYSGWEHDHHAAYASYNGGPRHESPAAQRYAGRVAGVIESIQNGEGVMPDGWQ